LFEWTVAAGGLTDGAYYAAVSFYLALVTNVCLNLCGADGPIIVEGPFAQNQFYLAMLESASGRPVLRSDSSATGTSIGAAMLTIKDLDEALQEPLQAEAAMVDHRLVQYADHWHERLTAGDVG
ncbi:MAG: carbohydrate kinase, partial [Hyphomicrobiales bacterium]